MSFIQRKIRGGISQYVKRYVKANNKYMKTFDKTKSSNYLMYLDSNNLYGWGIFQNLQEEDFKFINIPDHLKENKISDSNQQLRYYFKSEINKVNLGAIYEVNLEYSDELTNLYKDLPLAPEHFECEYRTTLNNK